MKKIILTIIGIVSLFIILMIYMSKPLSVSENKMNRIFTEKFNGVIVENPVVCGIIVSIVGLFVTVFGVCLLLKYEEEAKKNG